MFIQIDTINELMMSVLPLCDKLMRQQVCEQAAMLELELQLLGLLQGPDCALLLSAEFLLQDVRADFQSCFVFLFERVGSSFELRVGLEEVALDFLYSFFQPAWKSNFGCPTMLSP